MPKIKKNSDTLTYVPTEYKQRGDFLNIKMPITDVKIKSIRAKDRNVKRSIEIVDPQYPEKSLFINGNGKIGQLADFLGINRKVLYNHIDNNSLQAIQTLIDNQNKKRIVQINASIYTFIDKHGDTISNFYVFAISTIKHVIVTFTEIESVVVSVLGDTISEGYFKSVKAYVKTFNIFEAANDTFLSSIQVTTGKNTKASAVKVVVRVKVGSCNNSIICANYTAIKRTEGCLKRLRQTLIAAKEVIQSTQEIITAGTKKPMTLEEGLAYIDNIKVSIKNEEKIQNIKTALKARLHYEHKKNPNRFSLSQALSYGGTHWNPEQASEKSLEMLSEQSFEVLAASSLPIIEAM
jgi:hypothetical protein